MQTRTTNQTIEEISTTFRSRKLSPFLCLAGDRDRQRKIRITFSPRRESCLTKRTMLAAMREAEFAEWMNTGGDYLSSGHQLAD
jgi:hypothetical protein